MRIYEIKSIIKGYIVSQLDGFDDFDHRDNLEDMGILTDEFVFKLIQFLEKEFNVTIYKHELYPDKKSLSVNSIENFIEQKVKRIQTNQVTL